MIKAIFPLTWSGFGGRQWASESVSSMCKKQSSGSSVDQGETGARQTAAYCTSPGEGNQPSSEAGAEVTGR